MNSNNSKLCQECGSQKATVSYKDKEFCNWYCTKKGTK